MIPRITKPANIEGRLYYKQHLNMFFSTRNNGKEVLAKSTLFLFRNKRGVQQQSIIKTPLFSRFSLKKNTQFFQPLLTSI